MLCAVFEGHKHGVFSTSSPTPHTMQNPKIFFFSVCIQLMVWSQAHSQAFVSIDLTKIGLNQSNCNVKILEAEVGNQQWNLTICIRKEQVTRIKAANALTRKKVPLLRGSAGECGESIFCFYSPELECWIKKDYICVISSGEFKASKAVEQ